MGAVLQVMFRNGGSCDEVVGKCAYIDMSYRTSVNWDITHYTH